MAIQGVTTSFSAYDLFGVPPLTTSTSDILAQAYQKNAEKQITKQQQLIADKAQVQIDEARREMQQWMPLTDGINAAEDSIRYTQSQLKTLENTLFKMIGALNTPSTGDWTTQAAKFDALRSALNSAGNSGGSSNLLGSVRRGDTYQSNQLQYQINPDPRSQVTIFGKYAGSDYKINLPDDTFWMPSGTQQVRQYASFPNGTIGYPQSTAGGATKLDAAFNAASLSFSVGNAVQAPQSYSGSLQRNGLGVLQSWLYEGLSTSDGRARALEDVQHARNIVKNLSASFEAAMTQVTSDLTTVQSHIDEQQSRMTELSDQANAEVQTYVAKIQAQVQVQLTAAANVATAPAVQLVKVGGRIGRLFDLMT